MYFINYSPVVVWMLPRHANLQATSQHYTLHWCLITLTHITITYGHALICLNLASLTVASDSTICM